MYEMKRKPEPTLLPTQGIFNLTPFNLTPFNLTPYRHEELTFDDPVSYTSG